MKSLFNKETTLKPITPQIVTDFLEDIESIFPKFDDADGPIHVVFPQVVTNQITRLQSLFRELELDVAMYFAHKPTKSSALIQSAIDAGINIDVASLPELEHVLSLGCAPDRIEATGSKNHRFLKACIDMGILISVDSLSELEQISDITNDSEVRVLLRIADPVCVDRNKKGRMSRFGIPRVQIEMALEKATEAGITVCGFHIHNDEREADVKAGYIEDVLSFIEIAHKMGHTPSIVNIGGGLRDAELEYYGQWEQFLDKLEQELMTGKQDTTWRSFAYGMYLNDKGRISGRERIQARFSSARIEDVLQRTFQHQTNHGVPLHQLLNDAFLTVMTEPGYILTQGAGVSFVEVVGIADNPDGTQRIIVDANMYNLSVQMRELLVDPVLICKGDMSEKEAGYTGFIVGNLCREEDVLMRRNVSFDQVPKVGDYICFMNTAGYTSSFESASPHMHSVGQQYVAQYEENNWNITKEI